MGTHTHTHIIYIYIYIERERERERERKRERERERERESYIPEVKVRSFQDSNYGVQISSETKFSKAPYGQGS